MTRYLKLSDKWVKILKGLLFVSIPFLTLFFSRHCTKLVLIFTLILSIIIAFIAVKKMKSLNKMYKKIDLFVVFISALITNYIMKYNFNSHLVEPFSKNFYNISDTKLEITAIIASFALLNIVYYLIKKLGPGIVEFFKSLSKREKWYLGISSICSFVLLCIVYNMTSAFYHVGDITWDVIYTTDSPFFMKDDSFFNMGSSINESGHSPLLTVFAIPFALLSKILSSIFFMIPNSSVIFLVLVHIILLNITIIMLARLLKLKENQKILFYLFFLCCFSTVSFYMILEKYIIALFYIIYIIYNYYNSKQEINYSYIGGISILTTSGILFPFISKSKKFKKWILDILKCFGVFLAILIVSGQFPPNLEIIDKMCASLKGFSGVDIPFSECLMQYLNFVKGIFVALPAHIGRIADWAWYESYLIDEVHHYSKMGILILIICCLSVILNRKNKMALISGFWVLFSFIILCVIGWGTFENGLNLYSLYFSWAYIILVYLFIDKLIKNEKLKAGFMISVCIILLIINIPELINIINFGIEYYPV